MGLYVNLDHSVPHNMCEMVNELENKEILSINIHIKFLHEQYGETSQTWLLAFV